MTDMTSDKPNMDPKRVLKLSSILLKEQVHKEVNK